MRPAVAIVRRKRLHAGAALSDLLAVARDDEQAVVNREPEAQTGHQVQREDRDRADFARDGQEQEGRDDRKASDEERQRGGYQAPEEEEREQEQDGEGQELCALQVRFNVLIDLLLGYRVASDEDVVLALELPDDGFAGVLKGVVLGDLELDREVRGLAVLRDESIGLRLGKAGDASYSLDPGHLRSDLGNAVSAFGGGGVGALDQDDRLRVAVARPPRASPSR